MDEKDGLLDRSIPYILMLLTKEDECDERDLVNTSSLV